jgi:hypothetical protein
VHIGSGPIKTKQGSTATRAPAKRELITSDRSRRLRAHDAQAQQETLLNNYVIY